MPDKIKAVTVKLYSGDTFTASHDSPDFHPHAVEDALNRLDIVLMSPDGREERVVTFKSEDVQILTVDRLLDPPTTVSSQALRAVA